MNEIDLTPQTDPSEDDREATPMLILLAALTMASILAMVFSYAMGHRLILIISAIFAPVLTGCFGLEYFGLVHFVFGNDCDIKPAPKPTLEEIMQVQPTAAELRARAEAIDRSNNIRSHSRSKTLGWTCSYCDTINIWNPGREAVRCVHCGARYDGEELRELQ